MAALPYMALYVSDYLSDTTHLTLSEHGAYLLLIMRYWQTGKPLPNDDALLARIVGIPLNKFKKMSPTLKSFFYLRDAELVHFRIEKELEKAREKSDKSRAAGVKSAEKRWRKSVTDVKRTLSGCSTDVERTCNHTDPDPDQNINTIETTNVVSSPEPKNLASGAKAVAKDDTPVFLTLPLNDNSEHPVTEGKLSQWQELYPAVDVPQALRNMKGWLLANPKLRKTKSGVDRFINAWLSKEQNRGRGATNEVNTKPSGKYQSKTEMFYNNIFGNIKKKMGTDGR